MRKRVIRLIAAVLLLAAVAAAQQQIKIVDKPIVYDDERKQLTLEYIRLHQGGEPKDVTIDPKVIVLHWTGGTTSFDAAWNYFNRNRIEGQRTLLAKNGALNVSAQFLIDRDGTIYRLMPETWFARHCIGLNQVAIGVENVGDGKQHPLTDAQVEANIALVRYLKGKYPGITYLIGHHEYRLMEKSAYFKELDSTYRTGKVDPGAEFMRRVREKVADLKLEGPPAD